MIVDLCAGSGAWSEPYARAGYRVLRVTLPECDVRTWELFGASGGCYWCNNADHRAITPAGFARAFFEANP
jgi:hypothetical protein